MKAIIDPVYLEVDSATGVGGPGNLLPPNVPVLPPSMAPLVPQGASGCSWVFVAGALGKQQAIHLLGVLQGANPGLEGRIYTTSVPVLLM